MNISNNVCSYVQLTEGGDGQSWVSDVLYVSVDRRVCDNIEKFLGLVCPVCGQQDICGEDHTIPTGDIDWLHKDDNIS